MLKALYLLLALWPCVSVQADVLRKQDFAYGIDVDVMAHQLYQFEATEAIYRQLQFSDVRDLRIFDESGATAPMDIVNPPQVENKTRAHTRKLILFPVIESSTQATEDLSVFVQRNPEGTIVSINSTPPNDDTKSAVYYIADFGEQQLPSTRELIIDWDNAILSKARVTVDASTDLSHWNRVGDGAVFHIEHENQTLLRNTISLHTTNRYLKISLENAPANALRGVDAVIEHPSTTRIAPTWSQATLIKESENEFSYAIPPGFPISAIRAYPAAENAIYGVEIKSASAAGKNMLSRQQGAIYALTIDSERITTEAVAIGNREDRLWQIKVLNTNQPKALPPRLEFSYVPHHILFLTNQAGTYTVAFGNAALPQRGAAIPTNLDRTAHSILELTLPTMHTLGGEKMKTPPTPPKSYTKIMLWLVLAAVLAVMSYMVWRLLKHMRMT